MTISIQQARAEMEQASRSSAAALDVHVLVCGGGKLALNCAAHLAWRGLTVSVLTRQPGRWSQDVSTDPAGSSWESRGEMGGRLNAVTNRPETVVPDADIILICAPAHAHPDILRTVAPHLSATKPQDLATVFAQGGFDLAVKSVLGEERMGQLRSVWGLQNVPYICSVAEPGHRGIIIGPKKTLYVAASPVEMRFVVADRVAALFEIEAVPVPNFLTLTLTPSNQIIHPARYYGIFHDWDGERTYTKQELAARKGLTLYADMDEFSAEEMAKLDNELQQVKHALLQRFPQLDLSYVLPMRERVILHYGEDVADSSSLRSTFATNLGYAGCATPLVEKAPGRFQPAVDSRLFWEDVPYGLVILKSMAEMLGNFPTPSIDKMIRWHQQWMARDSGGKEYLLPDGQLNAQLLPETGAPYRYGIHCVEDLVRTSLPREMVDWVDPRSRL